MRSYAYNLVFALGSNRILICALEVTHRGVLVTVWSGGCVQITFWPTWSCINNQSSYRRPYPSRGVALIIKIMKSDKSFGRLMTTPHLSPRIWSMLPYWTLLSLVFGIKLHGLHAPSLTGAWSPWSWVPAGMKIADKTRDILKEQFYFTHAGHYVKVFH